jgi:hypothetical protein
MKGEEMNLSTRQLLPVFSPAAFLLSTTLVLPGCSFLIQSIAQERVKQLKLPGSQATAFVECVENPGGVCPGTPSRDDILRKHVARPPSGALSMKTADPSVDLFDAKGPALKNERDAEKIAIALKAGAPAARKAAEALRNPVQADLAKLFNLAKRAEPARDPKAAPGQPDIVIDVGKFDAYLAQIEEATIADGWDALALEGLYDTKIDKEDRARRAYIAVYFAAYFRNGKFYDVTLAADELKKSVIAKLKTSIPGAGDDTYKELADKLFGELGFDGKPKRVFGKINSEGFVTRGGQELKFPSVEAELSLSSGKAQITKIDYVAVGADLVRVLLHAVYDAHDRLPGVTNATAYRVTEYAPAANDPNTTRVDAEAMGRIESRAVKVETVTTAGMGRVIRGIGFVALNNEALAAAIETAIGVAVRKSAEKILWCWTACGFEKVAPVLPEEVTINIAITGEPAASLGRARPSN